MVKIFLMRRNSLNPSTVSCQLPDCDLALNHSAPFQVGWPSHQDMIFQVERTDIMSFSHDVSNEDIQIYMEFGLASLADLYHQNNTESFFLGSA